MRVHAKARASTFYLESPQFHGPMSGRPCPLVPELTYPFCTRVRDAAAQIADVIERLGSRRLAHQPYPH